MDFYKLLTPIEAAYKISDDYIGALQAFSDASLSVEQKKILIPHVLASLDKLEDLWRQNVDTDKQKVVIDATESVLNNLLENDLAYREHELVNFCRYLKPWSSHMRAHNGQPELCIRFPMVSFLKQFEFTFHRFGMSADAIRYMHDELQKMEMLHEKYMHRYYKNEADVSAVSSSFADLVNLIDLKIDPSINRFSFLQQT